MIRTKKTEVHYGFRPGTQPVVVKQKKLPRAGIYSGSFDPVHAGHIMFALHSQSIAGLDCVYFVPERRPEKDGEPEHYVHRSVMLHNALQPYEQFRMFELPDAHLTVRSLHRMLSALPEAEWNCQRVALH